VDDCLSGHPAGRWLMESGRFRRKSAHEFRLCCRYSLNIAFEAKAIRSIT
jgi:hypothetical protein